MLPQRLLDELKIILRDDYGHEATPEELLDVANTLVGFFSILGDVSRSEKLEAMSK